MLAKVESRPKFSVSCNKCKKTKIVEVDDNNIVCHHLDNDDFFVTGIKGFYDFNMHLDYYKGQHIGGYGTLCKKCFNSMKKEFETLYNKYLGEK